MDGEALQAAPSIDAAMGLKNIVKQGHCRVSSLEGASGRALMRAPSHFGDVHATAVNRGRERVRQSKERMAPGALVDALNVARKC
jgi:hypothetical protein